MSPTLRALYYPYSRCLNEQTLKRAILVFDEVWLADPLSTSVRARLLSSEAVPHVLSDDWKTLADTYGMLFELNLLKVFNPYDTVMQYDSFLTAAFEADNRDDDFWRLCLSPHSRDTWSILKERVPPSVFKHFRASWNPGYVGFVMEQAKLAFGQQPSQIVWADQIPAHVAPELAKGGERGFVKATPREIFDHIFRQIFSDQEVAFEIDFRRPPGPNDRERFIFSCLFSFAHGSSLSINEALLSADILDAALVTDSDVHHKLLALKYQRAAMELKNTEDLLPDLRPRLSSEALSKLSVLSFALINHFLPDETLARLSVEDCCRYRDETREARRRFQELLLKVTAEIESEIWEKGLETEITKVIYGKLGPEARKMEDEMAEVGTKMFGNLAVVAGTVAAPSLVAAIYPNMSNIMVLLMGSAAVAGGALALAVKEIKDHFIGMRQLKNNGLSYLIGLKSEGR